MLRLQSRGVLHGLVSRFRLCGGLIFVSMVMGATGCVTSSSGDATVYQVRVENGDTLSSLSGQFDTDWRRIARMNGLGGKNPLRVGQVLRIPAGPRAANLQINRIEDPASSAKQLPGRVSSKSGGNRDDDPQPAAESGDDRSWQEEDLNSPRKTPGVSSSEDEEPGTARAGRGAMMGEPAQNFVIRWPAAGDVSSNYGPRWGRFHNGIDIRANRGTRILAAAEGRVIFVGRLNGYGKTVIIDHGQYRSLYGHCGKIVARQGTWVKGGTHVAHVGISGNSRGAHLHFELRTRRDQPVDPIPFMEAKLLSSNPKKSRKKTVRTAATH
jgi:murein DD-endopeptidase MepM/ murein hydrolase activator NlpD